MDARRRFLLRVEVKSNGACPRSICRKAVVTELGCMHGVWRVERNCRCAFQLHARIDGCGRVERICVDTIQHCMHDEWSGTATSHVSPRRGVVQRYASTWMHLRTPPATGRDGTGRAPATLTPASARRPAFSAPQAAIARAQRRHGSPRPAVSVVAVPS